MITSITPQLDLSDISNGIFYVYIGYHGIPVDIQEFKKQVVDILKGRGTQDFSPEHIIRNLAIFVAMNAVDITKLSAIKTSIESGSFKI